MRDQFVPVNHSGPNLRVYSPSWFCLIPSLWTHPLQIQLGLPHKWVKRFPIGPPPCQVVCCHIFSLGYRFPHYWKYCQFNAYLPCSQSGGTPETRNGLLEVQKAFREAGLDFAKQVLISGFSFC